MNTKFMTKICTLVISILMISSSAVFADCRDAYKQAHTEGQEIDAGPGALGLFVFGISTAFAPSPFTIVGLSLVAGGIVSHEIVISVKYHRILRLINESEAFADSSGPGIAGSTLTKLHRKLKKNGSSATILQVAQAIKNANDDNSLCSNGNLVYFRDLKNGSMMNSEVK